MANTHSKTGIGGSTAKQVIACPGSVHLCKQYPDKPAGEYADRGTLLHDVMSNYIDDSDYNPKHSIGNKLNGVEITEELYEDKIVTALALFNEYFNELENETKAEAEIEAERVVGFGSFIPDVFGTCDVLGRVGNVSIVLDWKFGDGVPVEAENNHQLMFYAAGAARTAATKWAFKGTTLLDLVIIQPPFIRKWRTNMDAIKSFEVELKAAAKIALGDPAGTYVNVGSHCRWCRAKDPHPTTGAPLCPAVNGGLDRIKKHDLSQYDATKLGLALQQYRDIVEPFGKELERLVFEGLEAGLNIKGWKLVEKRATRKWKDEEEAGKVCTQIVADYYMQLPELAEALTYETSLKSPAQMEKTLKKCGVEIPEELIAKVSSGTTIAPESDPRPAALQIGKVLANAMSKLQ